jgi:hypothetical protein
MDLDRLLAGAQDGGNLFIRLPRDHEAKHLALTCGQGRGRRRRLICSASCPCLSIPLDGLVNRVQEHLIIDRFL